MSQWDPQGCLKVAESHLSLAGWFRHHGDVKAAEFCEAWARWYYDRAEGKPGEDALPTQEASCCRYHAAGGTRKSCGHATPVEIVPPKVRDYMASLHTDVVVMGIPPNHDPECPGCFICVRGGS